MDEMHETSRAADEHKPPPYNTANKMLQRNSNGRRAVIADRRRRLNSIPTKFAQTDEELHKESIREQVRETRSLESNSENTLAVERRQKFGDRMYSDTAQFDSFPRNKSGRIYHHEHIYRGLLRSLLHPLGAPDSTVGLRPGDLLDHLREVFEVERDDHEWYIMEEMPNRPQNMQLNVTVLEANGIRGADFSEDTCDSYCMLTLHHPTRGRGSGQNSPKMLSPKVSPKGSQRVSPVSTPSSSPRGPRRDSLNLMARSLSPVMMTKGPLSLEGEVLRTSTIKSSSHPKWNEEFSLDVDDYLTDELHIYVCDQDYQPDVKHEKQSAVKHFLSVLRHNSEPDLSYGYLGKTTIPVRDISALGTDEWYDIVSIEGLSKGKPKAVGKCHLRMGISYKRDVNESACFSSEDYYQAYRQFLNYTYKNTEANPSRHVNDRYGSLSLKDHRTLKMFAEANRISKLSQAIIYVICLLEMQCDDSITEIGDINLHIALDDLRMTWAAMQIGQKLILDRMPLTDIEISNYRKVAAKYIHLKSESTDMLPELFPPTLENLNILKSKLGVIVQLLGLDLWEPKCNPKAEISEKLLQKLHTDLDAWINQELSEVDTAGKSVKDKIIPEMEKLIDLVDGICSHCSVIPVLRQFYNSLGINYYRVISFALEKKVSATVINMTEKMNRYKKRYNNFSVNIMMASRLTLKLYFSLRRLHNVIRDNISRRDTFRLALCKYQEWFEESMIYWLQTFRSECVQRMTKALEIDQDVVVVTSLVKYSHSSVDVLSCFAQVIREWRKIDVRDPDCALLGVTNITDIICDGARLYAEKVHSILEKNRYFDDKLGSEFDVNDRLCITLNNIEHVRLYLAELPQLLAWENIVMMISTRYVDDSIGKQALATLQRLIDMANDEILNKSRQLLRQICEKMKIEIEKAMVLFTRKEPEKASSVDSLLGYISSNLQTLEDQLMPDICPHMIEQLWRVILSTLDTQIMPGQPPDYYLQMKQHLRSIGSFFTRSGLSEKALLSELYEEVRSKLTINSKSSLELILDYYKHLAVDVVTPTECYGHLAYKAFYMEETRGNITVYVTVLRGSDLPGLDASGFSDPYVEVSLQPLKLFGFPRVQKTQVVKRTLNPVFNVTFQFPNIPKDFLEKDGACILFSVYDHDHIGRDDFAGEVVVHLPTMLKIGMDKSSDRMPAVIMPLKRPSKPADGPFAILSERDWDKDAKKFITDRCRIIDNQPSRTDKGATSGGTGFFTNLFNTLTS